MQKEELLNMLVNDLVPVYKARYDFVNSVDNNFFQSATGQAELLNMALISQKAKTFSNNRELKKINDDVFSTMLFHQDKESFLAPIRDIGWNIDFHQHEFRKLINDFAKDAGVDDFYNAVDLLPDQKAPVSINGDIKDWNEMKHSQVLMETIPAYYKDHQPIKRRIILPEEVALFCDKQHTAKKQINPMFLSAVQHSR